MATVVYTGVTHRYPGTDGLPHQSGEAAVEWRVLIHTQADLALRRVGDGIRLGRRGCLAVLQGPLEGLGVEDVDRLDNPGDAARRYMAVK